MGLQSLRDKLLQAGLVTEEQARKAEADIEARKRQARERRQAGGGKGGKGPKGQGAQPQQARRELTEEEKRRREEEAAFREKERLLAKEREENRKRAIEDRKKLEALRTICEKYEIAERGDEPFHFTSRKKKVMRMYLTPTQLEALQAGQLAIIDKPLPGELTTALVPREAAEEALKVDSRALRFYNRGGGETYGFRSDAPLPSEAPAVESEAHETSDADAEAAPAREPPAEAEKAG